MGEKKPIAFEDPAHPGNSMLHHTSKLCIEGCGRPAGTAWSAHWCFECNATRMRRIGESLRRLTLPAGSGG